MYHGLSSVCSDVLEFEQAGRADKVGGSGAAAGRNVNVALTSDQGVGDADYLEVRATRPGAGRATHSFDVRCPATVQVFRQVVVPVAREYKPELVSRVSESEFYGVLSGIVSRLTLRCDAVLVNLFRCWCRRASTRRLQTSTCPWVATA